MNEDIINFFKIEIEKYKNKFSEEDYRQINNKLVEIRLGFKLMDDQKRIILDNLNKLKNIIKKYE